MYQPKPKVDVIKLFTFDLQSSDAATASERQKRKNPRSWKFGSLLRARCDINLFVCEPHDTICIVIAERFYKRIKPAYEIWNAAANAFRRCVTTATWVDRGELFFLLHRCEFGATKLIHSPLCQVGTTTCSCRTTLGVLDAASLAFTCLASGQRFQRALFWA